MQKKEKYYRVGLIISFPSVLVGKYLQREFLTRRRTTYVHVYVQLYDVFLSRVLEDKSVGKKAPYIEK